MQALCPKGMWIAQLDKNWIAQLLFKICTFKFEALVWLSNEEEEEKSKTITLIKFNQETLLHFDFALRPAITSQIKALIT